MAAIHFTFLRIDKSNAETVVL